MDLDAVFRKRFKKVLAFSAATLAAGILLAVCIPTAAATEFFDEPAPYVVITRDGHRIDAMEKPAEEGGRVKIRLSPSGQLAVVPTETIDWEATEKYNAARAKAASAPEAAEPSTLPAAGKTPGKPIKFEIVGGRRPVVTGAEEGAGKAPAPATATAAPAAAASADEEKAASMVAALSREFENLSGRHQDAVARRATLQRRLAELERSAGRRPAPSGDQAAASPSQRELARVRSELQALRGRIEALERRMQQIRGQAIVLGASLD
jgi:hypothetical protein